VVRACPRLLPEESRLASACDLMSVMLEYRRSPDFSWFSAVVSDRSMTSVSASAPLYIDSLRKPCMTLSLEIDRVESAFGLTVAGYSSG